MTSAKKHHFVPQFLLKHFARAGTSQVHVFDKLTGKAFIANVADIAAEHRLYEFTVGELRATIEPSLAEFESKAAAVLRGVMERDRLTGLTVYDRLVLSALVSQLMLRSTHQRASMRHMIEQARRHIAGEGTDPDSVPQLKTLDKNEEKEVNAGILSNVTQQFMPIIADKVWVLHEAPPNEILYISDNPVTMHNPIDFWLRGNLGLAVTGVEVYLPLSTSRCLALYCPTTCAELKRAHDQLTAKRASRQTESLDPHSAERLVDAFQSGAISPLGAESVKFVNSLQVWNAERYDIDTASGDDEDDDTSPTSVRVPFTEFLDGLVTRAGIYRQLVLAKTGIPALDRRLRNLRLIRAQPSYGFLMSLRAGGCTDKKFEEVLLLTEAFLLRRHTTRERTNENETVFAQLCGASPHDPVTEVRAVYHEYCPSDERFTQEFIAATFPSRLMDRARYCLEQFELARQGAHTELLPGGPDIVHVEHIIPQKIKTKRSKKQFGDWVTFLGQDALNRHPHYVSRIGNLTLFAGELNISQSNNPYRRKKAAYQESAFRLTQTLPADYREFKFSQVEARSATFADLALKIWPAI
jgi:hypothetical protein